MHNPYESYSDADLLPHLEWDSLAAQVWEKRHGNKTPAEVLYPTTEQGERERVSRSNGAC